MTRKTIVTLAAVLACTVMFSSTNQAEAAGSCNGLPTYTDLQKALVKAVKDEGTWRAWLGHDGIRFFVSEMSLELSRERGCAALKVHYYNEKGQLQLYSQWVQVADGATWKRCVL